MEIIRNYKPTPRALRFHSSTARFIVLVGGQGCVREDSLIQTLDGEKAIGEIQTPQMYRSWDGKRFVHSLGTAPFPKGKGMLYRVRHERGEFFCSAEHLTLCSDGEYRPASLLSGEELLFPLGTTAEFSQEESLASVLRLKQRVLSSLESCLGYFRRYDRPPLLLLGNGQGFLPSPAGVLGFSGNDLYELFWRMDDLLARAPKHSHRGQQSFHPSSYDSFHQAAGLTSILEDCTSSLSSGCTSDAQRESLLCRMKNVVRRIEQRCASVFHSLGPSYTKSTVLSVEKTKEDWYFDLQVTNTNNYVTGGAVHHNSGKSRALIEELVQSGIDYPGYPMAVYRKTLPSLRDSTLHEYRMLVPEGIGRMQETLLSYGFYNKSFINFRGLDDPNKAKSTNYATIVMEEADEFTYDDFKFLNGRIRAQGKWPLRIILLLNPVDETHWIYKTFVGNAEAMDLAGRESNGNSGPGLLVEHFSTYDNKENLPPGYIESMTAGMSPDEIDRYVHGKWGTILKGVPVYGKILNPDLHLRTVNFDSSMRVSRGWDFGFNHPACVWRVIDNFGRKNINHELLGDKEDIQTFARRVLEITKQRYGDAPVSDYGDPHGNDKKDDGESSISRLRELGIFIESERKVRDYVEPGIALVRKELSTLIEGVPELTIDPRCTIIRAAYFGKYVRDEDGFPKKDGFYDHLCFVAGTKILTSDGERNIEDIRVGDLVWTRAGLKPVSKAFSRQSYVISQYGLTGTPCHPIMTQDGWKRLALLTDADRFTFASCKLPIVESPFISGDGIIVAAPSTTKKESDTSTGTSMSANEDRSQRDFMFITKTGTRTIIPYPILKRSLQKIIGENTSMNVESLDGEMLGTLLRLANSPLNGMDQTKVESGTSNTQDSVMRDSPSTTESVSRAVSHSKLSPSSVEENGSARLAVNNVIFTRDVVYNLTVEDEHEYFANGILVSNCDADRYLAYNHKSNSVVKDLILSRKNRARPVRNRYTGY